MKKTKYLNQQFGVWTCVKVNVARVQPAFLKNSKVRSARPHHQTYSYTMATNLLGNDIQVELNAKEAAKMYRGEFDPIFKVFTKQGNAVVAIR
jgi:hypothetical protein